MTHPLDFLELPITRRASWLESFRGRWRGLRWRWLLGRRVGFLLCRNCHHLWRGHYAHGYRCNHPLDPEEWDVEYGCSRCDGRGKDCDYGLESDQ